MFMFPFVFDSMMVTCEALMLYFWVVLVWSGCWGWMASSGSSAMSVLAKVVSCWSNRLLKSPVVNFSLRLL